MPTKTNIKNKVSNKKKIVAGVGVGLAVAAAAAAGAYFLTGKRGAKNRKAISAWAVKVKKDVATEVKKMKVMNEKAYNQVVSKVTAKYRALKNVDPKELMALANELKGHWQVVASEVAHASSKTVRTLKNRKAKATPKRV